MKNIFKLLQIYILKCLDKKKTKKKNPMKAKKVMPPLPVQIRKNIK